MPRKKFDGQMSVIRVRKQYAAPYLKYRYVYLKRKEVRTRKGFLGTLKEPVKSWPEGTYYLKQNTGKVFCRFDVKEGRIRTIYKTSPATGDKYPIWDYIKSAR